MKSKKWKKFIFVVDNVSGMYQAEITGNDVSKSCIPMKCRKIKTHINYGWHGTKRFLHRK